jgi:Na+/H+ antiporter NhaD/arsenite permease-like protein
MEKVYYVTAIAIFAIVYLLIGLETRHKTHKAVIALGGAAFVLGFRILTQQEAFYSDRFGVDWNVIFLLLSMMIMINIMKPTGVFEYLGIKCARWARGDPFRMILIFSVVTAVVSAFVDNVTAVLLIGPVLLFITRQLGLDPVPFLVAAAVASNIGGTATLIGDPPNVMIASRAGLSFMDFVYHVAPVVGVLVVLYGVMLKFLFTRRIPVKEDRRTSVMRLDERAVLKDFRLIKRSLVVLGLVVVAFMFHDRLHLQVATIAFVGAGVMLLLSRGAREGPQAVLANIEWTSIFFFIGLFIIVGGIVKVGFITILARAAVGATGGSFFKASTMILWLSGVASAIVDNIPFVATMNPLILDMAKHLWPGVSNPEVVFKVQLLPLWWSLSLGACLGGNGTIVGASANVLVTGISEKAAHKVTFGRWMIYAGPVWLMTLVVSNLYIWLRYFHFAK